MDVCGFQFEGELVKTTVRTVGYLAMYMLGRVVLVGCKLSWERCSRRLRVFDDQWVNRVV
jgi:hypothetical protein